MFFSTISDYNKDKCSYFFTFGSHQQCLLALMFNCSFFFSLQKNMNGLYSNENSVILAACQAVKFLLVLVCGASTLQTNKNTNTGRAS